VDPLLVFLVPLGGQRYELYCERHHTGPDEAPTGGGWFAGVRQKFSAMLKKAEEGEDQEPESSGLWARLQARMMAWVAERVAEQRLLWNLRGRDTAIVTHTDDMPFEQVMEIVRTSLRADHRRHMRWLIVDTLLFVGSGVFFFVPGPNIIAYFFAFRLVGHWLSMRGAAHGRDTTAWTGRPSAEMTALRAAVARPAHERARAIEPIARELDLHRLTVFVDRMCGGAKT
jgi:K+-H+ exchange-related protein